MNSDGHADGFKFSVLAKGGATLKHRPNQVKRTGLIQCVLAALFSCALARAEDLNGDVAAEASAIYSGNTYHGYAEIRVSLENRSQDKEHVVDLIYPNNSYAPFGNNISRITRTVAMAPGAREVVSLYQPPLPMQGDSSIRVDVDGSKEGLIHAPNGNNHCSAYMNGQHPAIVFVSRTLVFDEIQRAFEAQNKPGGFTADMATGPPDVGAGGGLFNAWMPDTSRYHGRSRFPNNQVPVGSSEWLELDYAKSQTVDQVSVYQARLNGRDGNVILIPANPTNAPIVIPMSSASSDGRGGPVFIFRYSVPVTNVPVKTVRLEFGPMMPMNIAIDAVQISGPTGSQWAARARASSENSARVGAFGRSDVNTTQAIRAEIPISEWSKDWLAYSPFDAVVLSGTDLKTMPAAARDALGNYLWTGGVVVVAGKTELPPGWRPSQTTKLADAAEYEVGFGSCFIFDSTDAPGWQGDSTDKLRLAVAQTRRYWQGIPTDAASANASLPVVKNLKIPTRGIVLVMLGFIVLIGPVNIVYLNIIKRRTWMLWTIPAISFATTILVFAYSLFREGITPDTRIAGMTVLDQVGHRAATVGGAAFYCPLTPSGGLHFDSETEATPLVQINEGQGNAREMEWSQSQHLASGWVSARVPAFFHLRKTEPRSEGIQFNSANGKRQIVNHLGAPIKSLWISDARMNVYEVQNVGEGKAADLTPSSQTNNLQQSGAEGLLRRVHFSAQSADLAEGGPEFLRPDTYVAVLDGNPFLENALGGGIIARAKTSAIVYGILETGAVK